jgi:hypothetical protein
LKVDVTPVRISAHPLWTQQKISRCLLNKIYRGATAARFTAHLQPSSGAVPIQQPTHFLMAVGTVFDLFLPEMMLCQSTSNLSMMRYLFVHRRF